MNLAAENPVKKIPNCQSPRLMSCCLYRYLGVWGSHCGYCGGGESAEDTFVTENIVFKTCPPELYQELMDQTWRRCGTLLYRSVYEKTCCKPFTIRLDTGSFEPSKHQRKLLRRFLRHFCPSEPTQDPLTSLLELVSSGEALGEFRLDLVPACFEQESFQLYRAYQQNRHGDKLEDLTEERYRNFLVESPLIRTLPSLGTFHHRWFWRGRLMAVSVLDMLPSSLSSVYFYHDPELSKWSLGLVSAMLEIVLARWLKSSQRIPCLDYYYMGYYIAGCSKMEYKASLKPSSILRPADLKWIPLPQALDEFVRM